METYKTRPIRTLICLLVLCSTFAHADFDGRVIRILDGDTVEVLRDQQPVKVRLNQIDAPEKKQAFGEKSRQTLAALCFGKQVTVKEFGTDRYRRVLGTLYIGNTDINARMVQLGMAWVYRKYLTDPAYLHYESVAKANKLGLWADSAPAPPWEFRKRKKHDL